MLSYEEIEKNSQKITKIKLFVNKYNCEGINYPSEKEDLQKQEKKNPAIALNVSYTKKEKNISCLCFKT